MSNSCQKNDVLFAYKALSIAPGLADASRRVAGAVIDHFNRGTGQCDPSIERLETLLGIDRATVIRATEKLHDLGFIEKTSHGGKSHRAAYLPNWARFRAIVEEWNARMKMGAGAAADAVVKVASARRSRSQSCDVKRRSSATQTYLSNQSKEPTGACGNGALADGESSTQRVMALKGLLNGRAWPAPRPEPEVALVGEARKAAESAAMRRWDRDLMALGVEAHAYAIDLITPEIADEATSAERRRHGDGLRLLRERLHFAGLDRGGG
ncbi:helix-turn-helix domain-containing protein [Shinella sp. M27]|uniref:helix-turn-helix domain-containing protein n=1 Tax=Shinella sp. M27 TaxID=3368614 RepID=UPI003BA314E6